MAYQKAMMTAQEDLIEQIGDILKSDLGFLYKLAPRELEILANSLKDLVNQKKKYLLIDYNRKSIDF